MNYLEHTSHLNNSYFAMRHGKSMANEEEIIVSTPDDGIPRYGLVEEGRGQAARGVEEAIRVYGLDGSTLIVSSDFARARETAEIARTILGAVAVITAPALRERFFGDWDRQHHSNYQRVWADDLIDPAHRHHGVESTVEVLARTTSLIADLEQQVAGRALLLVSHGDALQILQTAFERVDSSGHRGLAHLETGEIRKLWLKATPS